MREINRTGKLPVLSTRLIVRRVFSHQRVHVFPPFFPFTPISLFFSPLVYSRPVTGICISLIPPAFQHLHARSSSIDSHRYRLTISFLEQTAYLRSSLGRNWPKPKICRDIFLSLVVPSRCSFSICHFRDDNHEIFKFQCNH